MTRRVAERRVLRAEPGRQRWRVDALAGEEPMEIRVNGDAVSVTMRTPGDDFDLAMGFCLSAGIVDDPADVAVIRYCGGGRPNAFNVVEVVLRTAGKVDERLRRNVYTTSSCGVCGTTSIDAVRTAAGDVRDDAMIVGEETLRSLPDRLRAAQRDFDRTGGLHAAAIFTAEGELVVVREDVGRHNAVDKLVGWAGRQGRLPLAGAVLMVSGRVAFEIVQKALVAGIPAIAAVSAPTSLAVELADAAGMTLVGFLRGPSMNIYSGAGRVLAS